MNLVRTCLASSAVVLTLGAASASWAQEVPTGTANTQAQSELDPHFKPATRKIESPERFIVELRGGPYHIFSGEAYDYFKNDVGPNLGVQLDGIVYRMPRLFYVTVGASIGTVSFANKATQTNTEMRVGEETSFALQPITATAQFRFDALPRRLGIPLILSGRIGWEWAHWSTDTGSRSDGSGWSLGPVFSGQAALDLDTFEPGGARALDEEWGINHTYLFAEVFHFAPTSKSLPVGATSWLIGLGFVF